MFKMRAVNHQDKIKVLAESLRIDEDRMAAIISSYLGLCCLNLAVLGKDSNILGNFELKDNKVRLVSKSILLSQLEDGKLDINTVRGLMELDG